MNQYQISLNAERAILAIADYTDARFGETQTEAYLAGLESSFGLIAQFPDIGVAEFEIKQGLRRYQFQMHNIFYTQQDGYVLIENIIHSACNIRSNLFS
nr:type II toxin-antitoxin system RelE/ParE family toxin [uncultured Cohaesibacter sp.]